MFYCLFYLLFLSFIGSHLIKQKDFQNCYEGSFHFKLRLVIQSVAAKDKIIKKYNISM
jgi:hypothetical protein